MALALQPGMVNYPNTTTAVSPDKRPLLDTRRSNQGSAGVGHEGLRNKTVAFLQAE